MFVIVWYITGDSLINKRMSDEGLTRCFHLKREKLHPDNKLVPVPRKHECIDFAQLQWVRIYSRRV